MTALCMLLGAVVVGKLYVLQVMHGGEYARRAEAQSLHLKNPLLNRGAIYFTDKNGAPVLAAALRPASAATSSHQRYYPGGSLAAHVLGFVAYNNDNEQKGRYGLERYYEHILSRSGESAYANFFVELFGGVASALGGEIQKGDLITTIEPTVQTELERMLAEYTTAWSPKLAGGIVMDPQTGEILAMAAHPTFDPNAFNQEGDVGVFGNPLAEGVFEMGSIIKALTIAAGLDAGVVRPTDTYDDTGCMTLDQKKICNFDFVARGVVDMQEVLSKSLNLGVAHIAQKLGPERMREYFLERLKLNQETGIDLPGEVRGLAGNLNGNKAVEFATASFGQGLAMTPVETVRALAALGNGGYLVTPHLVRAVRGQNGVMREVGWGEPVRVFTQETSITISRMLTEVMDTALLEGSLKFERHSVAAKTGTAQIANPAGGGYYQDRYLHSFFGYFPSYDPRFVVFLFAQEPKGATYASQTWARPFYTLTEFLLNYYAVPPDR